MKPLTLLKSPKSTLLNTAALLLFLLLPLMVTAQVKRTKKVEANGFVWHYVEGASAGAEDQNGNTLIPTNRGYSSIMYNTTKGIFHVNKGGKCGICDLTGKELISPDRGYTTISKQKDGYYVNKGLNEGFCDLSGREIISPDRGYETVFVKKDYFMIKKNGMWGACDLTGKEVVHPQYSNGVFYDSGKFYTMDSNNNSVDIPINSSGSSSVSVSSSISSTTSYTGSRGNTSAPQSNTSQSSGYGTLLKGGTFTNTGIINVMGNYASSGPYLTKFQIYTNYLVDEFGKAYPFNGMEKVDGVNGRAYKSSNNLYYVWGDDQTLRKLEFETILGITTLTIYYIKPGDVRAAYSSNYSTPSTGGSSSYGGSNRQSQQSCKTCHGTGLCQSCNGREMVINHYTGNYGTCTYCNNPYKGKCSVCKGSGKR